MKALHSNKLVAEKDAFLGELLAGLPKADRLLAGGDLSLKARRLHERYLPLHILSHYRPASSPLRTDYFEAVVSHWIESECVFALGFRNAGMTSLRSALEAAIKLVYYEQHPVEWQLHQLGKHDLHGKEFREFLYRVPRLADLPFISSSKVEPLWIGLCKFVHTDLRTVSTVSVVGDIKSVIGLAEAKFAETADYVHKTCKVIVSCVLSIDPNWLLGVEKAYFDAVFDTYPVFERSRVKEKLRIA